MKAGNYQELTLKAITAYKVNPNNAVLTFKAPNDGAEITLENEDTYEFLESIIDG